MKAHEMYSQMSTTLAVDIISFFYQTDRNVYKTTVSTLASQRKLRPVFVTKKSRDAQFQWIIKSLQTRRSDEIAQHLLQAWLMKAKSELLIAFLEKLEIEHDGTGAVEELPKSLDPEKLKIAIDAVLEQYPAEEVSLYLHMFQLQEQDGWPELAERLENDTRLYLGDAPAAPAAKPSASEAGAENPATPDAEENADSDDATTEPKGAAEEVGTEESAP